jgi:hypothetical protein
MSDRIATEAGHWYTRTGEPAYTVKMKNGEERATTLRDGRKLQLVPSVTTVLSVLSKPALTVWKEKQILMAALTLPRLAGETDDAFAERVIVDSKAQAKAAAERGTALHGAVERHITGQTVDPVWFPHVNAVEIALEQVSVPILYGKAERSFAHPRGYGGKVDCHGDGWVVDVKTKDRIGDKTAGDLAFDEHVCQLAAYAHGLNLPAARCLNVFVGVEDAKVVVHEWTADDVERGWQIFCLAVALWKLRNKYDGGFAVTTNEGE